MELQFKFTGTMQEIVKQIAEVLANVNVINKQTDTLAQVPVEEEPIKPVLTQEQMAENIANQPEHTLPPQPTLEDVRAELKRFRDARGSKAVKDLLKAFGADSVPALKEDHYLAVIETAMGGGVAPDAAN